MKYLNNQTARGAWMVWLWVVKVSESPPFLHLPTDSEEMLLRHL